MTSYDGLLLLPLFIFLSYYISMLDITSMGLWSCYWKHTMSNPNVRPCFNEGLLLDSSIILMRFVSLLILSNSVGFLLRHYNKSKLFRYGFIDLYVTLSFVIALLIFIFNSGLGYDLLKIYIIYKLFETFVIWIRHYILGDWNPINKYRSLLLAFIGYADIIFLYALLALIFQDHFTGINCTSQAFYYSVRNAVTIGASEITPKDNWGYAIFVSQMMFTILFLASVVSSIIGFKKDNQQTNYPRI